MGNAQPSALNTNQAQFDLLCVNANAAIDKTVLVPGFQLNEIHRPERVLVLPGGKGCNVARAARCMGATSVVTGWVGGHAGQFIQEGLRREGIGTAFVVTDFESRECLTILDPAANTVTEIYEKGNPVPDGKLQEFNARYQELLPRSAAVTLSGSLPPGVPTDFYGQLIAQAQAAQVPILLDTGGDALRDALARAAPTLVKPNQHELEALVGHALATLDQIAEAAHTLALQYATRIVVSLGAEGALAADQNDIFHVRAPQIHAVSAVGSGDSMLAGIAFAMMQSLSFQEIVRFGVAAGTANALSVGAGVLQLSIVQDLLSQIQAAPLSDP